MAEKRSDNRSENRSDSVEHTLQIRRCACVVKGGRRFSFAGLVVVGDGRGTVGWGYGKGPEVPIAVEKAFWSVSYRVDSGQSRNRHHRWRFGSVDHERRWYHRRFDKEFWLKLPTDVG